MCRGWWTGSGGATTGRIELRRRSETGSWALRVFSRYASECVSDSDGRRKAAVVQSLLLFFLPSFCGFISPTKHCGFGHLALCLQPPSDLQACLLGRREEDRAVFLHLCEETWNCASPERLVGPQTQDAKALDGDFKVLTPGSCASADTKALCLR